MPRPIAAIDVGSNSIRVAILAVDSGKCIDVIEEASAVPRLIRDVERHGAILPDTVAYVVEVLRDYGAIARAHNARVVAVATSAVRDAANSQELIERVRRESGVELRLIDGAEEARLVFTGAIYELPVSSGLVVDIGGGSMELVRFSERSQVQAWSLPLGAVRLADRFLLQDPPTTEERAALRRHVAVVLASTGLTPLPPDAAVIGTGGTARNIAKIDRDRRRYPIARLHGYQVGVADLRRLVDRLQSRSIEQRREISGLNQNRADSILAGAMALQGVLDRTRAASVMVSGQGLREGMAIEAEAGNLPPIAALRETTLDHLVRRFVPGLSTAADWRRETVRALAQAAGFSPPPEIRDAMEAAAYLHDIGRAVDYYNRARQTERLLLDRGLPGWTHREVAMICAIVRQGNNDGYSAGAYKAFFLPGEQEQISVAGGLLAVAEEVRLRQHLPLPRPSWHRDNDHVIGTGVTLEPSTARALDGRFHRLTGLHLTTEKANA